MAYQSIKSANAKCGRPNFSLNQEMSGGAKRSPLDFLVFPQPLDFYPLKIGKSTKIFLL